MKDLNSLADETVLQSYEYIRDQVAADARLGGKYRFMGLAAKERANTCSTSSGGAGSLCLLLIGRSGTTKNDGVDLRRYEIWGWRPRTCQGVRKRGCGKGLVCRARSRGRGV